MSGQSLAGKNSWNVFIRTGVGAHAEGVRDPARREAGGGLRALPCQCLREEPRRSWLRTFFAAKSGT